SSLLRCGRHATEPDVRHARVGVAAVTSTRAIARTVDIAAQERPAALNTQGADRTRRVDARNRPGRVDDFGARASTVLAGLIPVAAPLQAVAGHVVQAIAVRRKRLHGRRGFVAVLGGVAVREVALPDVRLPRAAGAG